MAIDPGIQNSTRPSSVELGDEDSELNATATYEPWISPKKQEFFLPLTGFGWLFQEEVEVVNHPAFQRLANINQLGQAYFVYRGATHKRIEHCLGVVAVAQKMISAVAKNAGNQARETGNHQVNARLLECEERFVRLGALLHDIGHLAAGHTLEDELGLIDLHDRDARLSLIFEKEDWPSDEFEGADNKSPCLRALVDDIYEGWIPKELKDEGLTATDIVRLLIRKPPDAKHEDPYAHKQRTLQKSSEIRFNVCANIIGNTICADLLDYLYRDWYHVGRARSPNDRIFHYMETRSKDETGSSWHDKRSPDDVFVISLGRSPRFRADGVSAILGLLEARYELAEAVLFHRTKLSAGAMLDRGLLELFEGEHESAIIERFLHLSDEELIDEAIREARIRFKKTREERFAVALRLLGRLKGRRLYANLVTLSYNDFTDADRSHILGLYSALSKDKIASRNNRRFTTQLLEASFDLTPGSIVMYCVEVKPKLAEVQIAVDERLDTFARLEDNEKHRNWLAGGHLAAQVSRFNRLSKLHFFISREELKSIGKERAGRIEDFIRAVVGRKGGESVWREARDKAASIFMDQYHGATNEVSFEKEGKADDKFFPNGAPSLTNFLRRVI